MLKIINTIIEDRHSSRFGTGFTLIELLIVIAIIAGLATIFVSTYPSSTRKARDAERMSDIKQYQVSLEAYANNNAGLYPSSADPSLQNVCSTNLNTPACPDDPLGTSLYQYVMYGSGTAYVIWATLELPDRDGNTQYFISCSNGLSGKSTTVPAGSCPLP